jgi:hypothetical protein
MFRLAAAVLMLAFAAVSAAAFVGSGVSITKVPVTAVGSAGGDPPATNFTATRISQGIF